MASKGGQLALVGLSDEIRDTMEMTGFLDFFIVAATVDEAFATGGTMPQSTMLERIDAYPTASSPGSMCVPDGFPVRGHARARRRQLLGLLAPRHELHAGALREGRRRAVRRDSRFPTSSASATSTP